MHAGRGVGPRLCYDGCQPGHGGGTDQAGRRDALGTLCHLAPAWLDPGTFVVVSSRRLVLVRTARRTGEADARSALRRSLAESWTASEDQRVYSFTLRPGLKFHNGDPFDRRGREVQLHAGEGGAAAPEGEGGRGRRPDSCGVRAARALAGLHDVLRHVRQRCWLDRAEELRGEGRTEFKRTRWALSKSSSATSRASNW